MFTDHGVTRYTLPDGRTVTVLAGFTRDSESPPLPEVFHGNPFNDADAAAGPMAASSLAGEARHPLPLSSGDPVLGRAHDPKSQRQGLTLLAAQPCGFARLLYRRCTGWRSG